MLSVFFLFFFYNKQTSKCFLWNRRLLRAFAMTSKDKLLLHNIHKSVSPPLKPLPIFLPLPLWGSVKAWNGHSRTSSTFTDNISWWFQDPVGREFNTQLVIQFVYFRPPRQGTWPSCHTWLMMTLQKGKIINYLINESLTKLFWCRPIFL